MRVHGGRILAQRVFVDVLNPLDVVAIVQLSRATYRKMIQNLLWATGYNTLAIPLAAGALYAWGVLLTPALGAVLMSASTVIVAINARLLKMKRQEDSKDGHNLDCPMVGWSQGNERRSMMNQGGGGMSGWMGGGSGWMGGGVWMWPVIGVLVVVLLVVVIYKVSRK